ncbi:glycosyltransferase, partial [Salmonella enterica subsp. enterica serovar Typhi]|nr:glycosyltransferase [Salmonella enterica subsp. enterica serovar Typhi]
MFSIVIRLQRREFQTPFISIENIYPNIRRPNPLSLPKCLVLLSTYNGEKYIEEQLDSLIKQEGVQLHVLIRDDGSTDSTINVINRFIAKFPKNIDLLKATNIG